MADRTKIEVTETTWKPFTGGETGPGGEKALMEWFRSLRKQCHWAKVPLFLKSL